MLPAMPVEFRHAELPNGLTVVAEVDPDAHSSAAGFFVRTGARDEAPDVMGVSHFLEHMMFKGTDRRSAEEVDRDFDAIGSVHNAFTTSEMTAFWAHCLPEHLAEATTILADILRPAIRQEDFDAEKQVILEEIAMYRDHPVFSLYERTLEVFYGDHPLAHRVLGTDETVAGMARERMLDYFHQRYSADNTVLALAGRLDFDAFVEQAHALCGGWQRTGAARDVVRPQARRDRFGLHSATVNRHYVLASAPAPSGTDEDRYPAAVLARILGDSEGSRFYWSLIETGRAEDAAAQFDGRDGAGEWIIYATGDPDDAVALEETLRTEIDALASSLEEDDLIRVRSRIATGVSLQGELPAGRMKRLGTMWTVHGAYRSLEEELARIDAVTLDDLHRVLDAWPMTPWVTGTLDPEPAAVAR